MLKDCVCPICGEVFHQRNVWQIYCSLTCKYVMHKERVRGYKKRKKLKSNGDIIDAYAREANRRHISYGTLQTERYIRKMREG